MSYLVLARRTRPQNLHELVGQNSIRNALKGMLESKKIPHAFLFTGVRGTGKTSTARILAKSLNCEQGPCLTPCQTCRHCRQITACSHEDVFEIDAASHTGVDNIRELRESARFYPVSARYKVFIIDEVHMLSSGAFNALLKTLEEPPPQVIFILATTELHKIPVTIRSRCLTFAFKKIATEDMCERLASILNDEKIAFENDALKLIAREAQGSLRDALSVLEQVVAFRSVEILTSNHIKQNLGLYGAENAIKIFQAICAKDQAEALNLLAYADEHGLDLSLVIEDTARYFRHALLLKTEKNSYEAFSHLLQEEINLIQKAIASLDAIALGEIFKILSLAVRDLRRSVHPLSWAEIVVIDAISRADWISAADMLLKTQQQVLHIQPQPPARQPVQTEPRVLAAQTSLPMNKKVDLDLYKKFVAAAKKRSPTLGARLGVAKLEIFTHEQVVFADTPENKTYLSFDSEDQKSFFDSLLEIGMKPQAVKGKNIEDAFISLYQSEENDKKKAFALKEKEIFSRESVKNLMILSKEIKLTPIEN